MGDRLRGEVRRIATAAERQASIDSFETSGVVVRIEGINDSGTVRAVRYQLDSTFVRPSQAVADGSPATMESSSDRVAMFSYDATKSA